MNPHIFCLKMKNAPIGTTIPGTVGHSIAHTGMLTRNVMIIDNNRSKQMYIYSTEGNEGCIQL